MKTTWMKRSLLMLCALLLALAPSLGMAEGHRCYTGPGKNYQYLTDLEIPPYTDLTLYSMAYDRSGGVWVQAEYQSGSDLVRCYLPKSSLTDSSLPNLYVEKRWDDLVPDGLAWIYDGATPRLGPGNHYNRLNFDISSTSDYVIIMEEDGWAMLETHMMDDPLRFWVQLSNLQY